MRRATCITLNGEVALEPNLTKGAVWTLGEDEEAADPDPRLHLGEAADLSAQESTYVT